MLLTVSINVGDCLPRGTLQELASVDVLEYACVPKPVAVVEALLGKRIVIFGVPGAFTPTCSGQHLPGYIENADVFKARGIDEVWCVSVNDAFVMEAWARDRAVNGRVRMLADGNAAYIRTLGFDIDLRTRGMGVRSRRFSMFVLDGVVKILNVEAAGRFEVSDAHNMLSCLNSRDLV